MATILRRKTKGGIRYQAQVRRRGHPPQPEQWREYAKEDELAQVEVIVTAAEARIPEDQ